MTGGIDLDKGGSAEEALRHYFLSMGSFVIRGVPFREGSETISDVDLWVYTRVSAYSRQISIVDVKNKKRSRAFERILWAKGLQAAVKADEAIVATSDGRDILTPFASRIGVRVLTLQPFRAIFQKFSDDRTRLTNEEMFQSWRNCRLRSGETVLTRIEDCLSYIGAGIGFAALNNFIDEAVSLFFLASENAIESENYIRAAYFISSLSALSADYLGRELAFAESEARRERFHQGLLYGSTSADYGQKLFDFSEAAVNEFLDPSGASSSALRKGMEEKLSKLPVRGLADFFTRPSAGREMLDGAIMLESAAFSRVFTHASDLRPEAKAILGAIFDYGGLPRRLFLGTHNQRHASAPEIAQKEAQAALAFVNVDHATPDTNESEGAIQKNRATRKSDAINKRDKRVTQT